MAFRIGTCLRSGVIDNSVRGRVTGKLHIDGIADPVTLDLQGNAHPDMAGCVLKFKNPFSSPIDPETAALVRAAQKGYAGDISASQKRTVPKGPADGGDDFSFDPDDFVLSNILYLEWYDFYNGRVVIEGVDYEWQIDLPRWRLSEEELAEQTQQAKDAANLFMNLAIEHYEDVEEEIRAEEDALDPDAEDEFTWEKRLRHSEDRVDAILTLLDEAKTDEQRRALLDKAFAAAKYDDETREDEPVEIGDPRLEIDDSWGVPDSVELDAQSTQLVADLGGLVDRLMNDLSIFLRKKPSETESELLVLAVKVKTVVALILEDGYTPFDAPGAGPLVEPGFLIALIKREIARAEPVLAFLQDNPPPELRDCHATVRDIRDRLVELAGRLRELR